MLFGRVIAESLCIDIFYILKICHCHIELILACQCKWYAMPGARPTNDVSIEFEVRPKFAVLWLKMNKINHDKILHMAQ